jgi:predicted metalloendopeptidase
VDVFNATDEYTENVLGVWVAQDLDEPRHYSVFLVQGGLGMPDREYYVSTAEDMRALCARYQAHVARVLALAGVSDAETRAARIVDMTVAHHRKWRGLRASLRALVATDAEVRTFYRAQRRRQLQLIAAMRGAGRVPEHQAERDAILLFTLERVCDAVAEGEIRDLGLGVAPTVRLLRRLVGRAFGVRPRAAPGRPASRP